MWEILIHFNAKNLYCLADSKLIHSEHKYNMNGSVQHVNCLFLPDPYLLFSAWLCSIVELFDYRKFDCVRSAKYFCEFDYRTQSNPIERLGSMGFDYRTFDWLRRADSAGIHYLGRHENPIHGKRLHRRLLEIGNWLLAVVINQNM